MESFTREQLGPEVPGPSRTQVRAAVIGHPVAHSLSPVMHRAAYRQLDLPYQYDFLDIGSEDVEAFLQDLDTTWLGLSVTMPHKVAAQRASHWRSNLVEQTEAANTVVVREGLLYAFNTDVAGICWALLRHTGAASKIYTVTIIGSGATARSATAAAVALGAARIQLTARREQAAGECAGQMQTVAGQCEILDWNDHCGILDADVVISTLPAGAANKFAPDVPDSPGMLLDVAYHPWPSRLAQAWTNAGGLVASGREMLAGQAAEQVRLMTGLEADAEVMLAAAENVIHREDSDADTHRR